MSSPSPLFVATGVAGLGIAYAVSRALTRPRLPLPPGPPKKFLVGNLFDMPDPSYVWLAYHNLAKEYNSDIIHLDAAGTSIVLLDSEEAITELLERRSAIYSSRPHFPMLIEFMGWTYNFAILPYDDFWRSTRRMFVHEFSASALPNYYPNQLRGTHLLLGNLLETPDEFMVHLRHWAGALVMSIAYGIDCKPNDPYLQNSEKALETLVEGTTPGAFLVDTFPVLRYLPEFMMKNGGFKAQARVWRKYAEDMTHLPFQEAKAKYESGVYNPSFTSKSLEKLDHKKDVKEQERIIEATGMSMFVAATDTTVSAIGFFIRLLRDHPVVQVRAQAELEAAYGVGHLPDFADYENDFDDFGPNASLPYVSAMLKELLRYEPVTPFSIPHLSTKDDVYKGYHIPAGSSVIGNAWSILHNEETYGPETSEFKPERFLLPNGKLNPAIKNPASLAFGFGRRICPGQGMAISSMWIAMVSILTAFNVTKVEGDIIDPTAKRSTGGLITYPLPFKCNIIARSEKVASDIRACIHNA